MFEIWKGLGKKNIQVGFNCFARLGGDDSVFSLLQQFIRFVLPINLSK
jgi:hypothetical protein